MALNRSSLWRRSGTNIYSTNTGNVGLNNGGSMDASDDLDVIGNFKVNDSAASPTKGYRFRTSGSNLDLDFSGADGFISVFSGANFSGTQRDKIRLESGANIVKAIKEWQFTDGPFGGTHHKIDGTTGGQFVINEDGHTDADFRVEGDTISDLLFTDASEDTLLLNGGQKVRRSAVNDTAYTVLLTDYIIAYTALSASRIVTLPTVASAGAGRIYTVKDEAGAAGTHNITIDGNGAELVDGAANTLINTNYGSKTMYCSGSAWFVI